MSRRMSRLTRPLVLLVALLAFWVLLSGRLDALFLTMGVVSALLVTRFAVPLLSEVLGDPEDTPRVDLLRLATYIGWLATRIPPAAVDVALSIVLPSRLPRPGVLHFTTGLHSPAARTLLANSITLVPGTMTLSVVGGEFVVHALSPRAAQGLATAEVQRRIARIFRVEADAPPVMRWDPIRTELPEEPR
jgi:multicomponent Na+:H+ antiporter subunit E